VGSSQLRHLIPDVTDGTTTVQDASEIEFDGAVVTSQGGRSALVTISGAIITDRLPLPFSFTGASNKPYIEYATAAYVTLAYVIFPGTAYLNASPTAISVGTQQSGGSGSHDVRVYDLTNAAEIGEYTGYTNTTWTPNALGTLANLSSGEAMWDISGKVSGGTKGRLSAMVIR